MPNHLTTLIGRISKAFSLITVCLVGAAHAAPLEEIIVTAQKRAQSLQDVPVSMTALTGEKSTRQACTALTNSSIMYSI